MTFKLFSIIMAFIASVRAGLIPSSQIAHNGLVTEARVAPLKYTLHTQSVPPQYVTVSEYPQQILYERAAQQVAVKDATRTYEAHPQYNYGYNIEDSITGDSKSQVETREGDLVQGAYSLIDADGFRRTVKYTADSVNGFNAVVSREAPNRVVNNFVTIPDIIYNSPTRIPYVSESAQVRVSDPVVKRAYALTPIVKATPVAYPISH